MSHSPAFLKLVEDAKTRVREITPEETKLRMERGDQLLLVDTREDFEWDAGHITGAVHIGKGIIERDIEEVVADKDKEIILYCGGGYRSALAADQLQKMGYRNIFSLSGGWRKWKELHYPIA
jgi:rhodanese-related sulfurtransferase